MSEQRTYAVDCYSEIAKRLKEVEAETKKRVNAEESDKSDQTPMFRGIVYSHTSEWSTPVVEEVKLPSCVYRCCWAEINGVWLWLEDRIEGDATSFYIDRQLVSRYYGDFRLSTEKTFDSERARARQTMYDKEIF